MCRVVMTSKVACLSEIISGRYIFIEPRNPKAIAKGVENVYNSDIMHSDEKNILPGWQC